MVSRVCDTLVFSKNQSSVSETWMHAYAHNLQSIFAYPACLHIFLVGVGFRYQKTRRLVALYARHASMRPALTHLFAAQCGARST